VSLQPSVNSSKVQKFLVVNAWALIPYFGEKKGSVSQWLNEVFGEVKDVRTGEDVLQHVGDGYDFLITKYNIVFQGRLESGIRLIQAVRQVSQIPIIVCTSHHDKREAGLLAGANRWIDKDTFQLMTMINELSAK